jgi:hypothetical protein
VPPQGGRKHPHQEFIQIDTTNILFICGGAFAGLDSIIESRVGHKGVGFHGTVRSKADKDPGELFAQVLPEDLLKFGMIPEFIGRLPMIGAVRSLDREALIKILVEPKNSLMKQYQKVFESKTSNSSSPLRRSRQSPTRHCCAQRVRAVCGQSSKRYCSTRCTNCRAAPMWVASSSTPTPCAPR